MRKRLFMTSCFVLTAALLFAYVPRLFAQTIEEMDAATKVAQDWLSGKLKDYGPAKVTYTGEPFTMQFTAHFPAVAGISKTIFEPSFRILEKMTNGKILVKSRYGATVHGAAQGIAAARDGLTDVAPGFVGYDPKSFHLFHVAALPYLFPNSFVTSIVLESLYPKYFKEEYERLGVYMGRIGSTAAYRMFSKKPIQSLDDMKGLKVRAGGGIQTEILKSLGAVPTSVVASQAYTAFQRGIIDAVYIGDAAAGIFKIQEIAKYRTTLNIDRFALQYCLSPKFYNKLPRDLQIVLSNWFRAHAQAEAQVFHWLGDAKARERFRKKGVQIVTLSAEEEKLWRSRVANITEDFIKEQEAAGRPARQLIADIKRLVERYSKMSPNEIMTEVIHNPIQGINAYKSAK
jgi:TRAP-type C4-dicarboxylate transport system substrate-binding protein